MAEQERGVRADRCRIGASGNDLHGDVRGHLRTGTHHE